MIKFAVIGASGMAQSHMQSIMANPNTKLSVICDINLSAAETAAKNIGADNSVRLISDYHEVLNDPEIDAAVVVTPDRTHCEITVNLLMAGKDVLCEKPMALNIEDCKAMISAEKKSGRKLMIGQICRYTPGFIKAKELVDEGVIGEIFFAESEYAHDYCNIGGAGNWRVDPERYPILGGGCHAVDLLRWVVGNPYEIFAYENHKMLPDWPVNDCSIAVMKFENGAVGKVMCSIGCKRTYTMRTLFYGSKGTIICDNTSPEITVFEAGVDENGRAKSGGTPRNIPIDINNHNTRGEISDFCDILISGKPVSTTGVEGASTVMTCLAVVESARTGLPVKLDFSTL